VSKLASGRDLIAQVRRAVVPCAPRFIVARAAAIKAAAWYRWKLLRSQRAASLPTRLNERFVNHGCVLIFPRCLRCACWWNTVAVRRRRSSRSMHLQIPAWVWAIRTPIDPWTVTTLFIGNNYMRPSTKTLVLNQLERPLTPVIGTILLLTVVCVLSW
jgi:hypothetical protein